MTAEKMMRPSNYEDRHPNDMVLHPLSEIREWDEALAVLGIQDSGQTPAEAIRELNAEIERLRASAVGAGAREALEPQLSEEQIEQLTNGIGSILPATEIFRLGWRSALASLQHVAVGYYHRGKFYLWDYRDAPCKTDGGQP